MLEHCKGFGEHFCTIKIHIGYKENKETFHIYTIALKLNKMILQTTKPRMCPIEIRDFELNVHDVILN